MKEKESSRALVIDDDDLVLTILGKMLQAEMFSVDLSGSAREALDRLPETRYDVIICDMWMPGMTGKDFYNQVKREFPEYRSRIIFLTGDIASETTWDFIEGKGLPYLLKPVSQPELRRKIQQVTGEEPRVEPKKGAELWRHPQVISKEPRVEPKKGAELQRHPQVIGEEPRVEPKKGAELQRHPQVISKEPRVEPKKGAELQRHPQVISEEPRVEPKKDAELQRHPQVIGEGPRVEPKKGAELRRHPRLAVKANLRVRKKGLPAEGAEITAVGNASQGGVYFVTDRNYSVGSEVLLAFPYSGPGDMDLDAYVVRVEERSGGRRGVALALGKPAAAARATLAPQRPGIVEQAPEVADLKLQLDRERKEAHRLTGALADLKAKHEGVTQERDRLATQGSDRDSQVRELTSARDAASRLVEELKQQVQDLQERLAAAEREQARQGELAVGAQQEAGQAVELKKELGREQETARRLTQELAELKAAHDHLAGERDRLATQESDRDSQVRELTSARDAASRLVEELKQQVQELQEKLAATEREQAQQIELAGAAQQETAQAADLKKGLDQEQETARRLTQELADLKAVHEGVTQERDRLTTQESDHNSQLSELTSSRDSMKLLIEEFQKKVHGLETRIAGVEAERDEAQKELGAARDEAQKLRAESRQQQEAAASTEPTAREQASSAKEQNGEVAKLREHLEELQARIQDFRDGGIGPLTNLAASCDLIAMKKSLDADTKESAKEMSQLAAQLRKAFQKLTRKK